MTLLRDKQSEIPYLQSRWLLKEPAGSNFITDDISGVILGKTGVPSLGIASMCKGDSYTCASGGYSSGVANGFQATSVNFNFTNGVTLEAVVAADPKAGAGNIFLANGQAGLSISANLVTFTVWIGGTGTAFASTPALSGWPQIVHGTYDPVADLQCLYLDGALVSQGSRSGSVSSTSTSVSALTGSSASVIQAQDIAVYNGALSANRVLQHFQAFAQIWYDPAHVRSYTPIGVTQ